MAEGILAEVVTATAGGAVLMGWALYLRCSPELIGILGALPFASQLVQLPSAWLSCVAGYRRVAIFAVAASRQVLWVLVALPFLPLSLEGMRAALMAVAVVSAFLGMVGNNAWVAWMGELVPLRLRGRYFGRRTALCTLGGTLASLAAGFGLDFAQAGDAAGIALSALAAVAAGSGIATTILMRRQHQPTPEGGRAPFHPRLALQPLADPDARRIIWFQVGWNGAIGLSSAFFAVHMLQNLGMGFALMAAYNAALAGIRILTGPLWGRIIDRVGARAVVVFCSFGVSVIPILWLFPQPGFLLPLALEVIVSGTLWGGHGLASFALPLDLSPRQNRQFYVATFASAGGVAFAASAALGGVIVGALPVERFAFGHHWYAIHAVFVISAACRFLTAYLSLRIRDPAGRPVAEVGRMLLEGAREAHGRARALWPPAARATEGQRRSGGAA